jgi:hypothetical protein
MLMVRTVVEKAGEQGAEEERTPQLKLVSIIETFIIHPKANRIAAKNDSKLMENG